MKYNSSDTVSVNFQSSTFLKSNQIDNQLEILLVLVFKADSSDLIVEGKQANTKNSS